MLWVDFLPENREQASRLKTPLPLIRGNHKIRGSITKTRWLREKKCGGVYC